MLSGLNANISLPKVLRLIYFITAMVNGILTWSVIFLLTGCNAVVVRLLCHSLVRSVILFGLLRGVLSLEVIDTGTLNRVVCK